MAQVHNTNQTFTYTQLPRSLAETLNNARVNRWKKAKPERLTEVVVIIRRNCLKVDKAIILFKPNSKFAPRPAINIVNTESNNKITFNQ